MVYVFFKFKQVERKGSNAQRVNQTERSSLAGHDNKPMVSWGVGFRVLGFRGLGFMV